jgi:hypothetical protein
MSNPVERSAGQTASVPIGRRPRSIRWSMWAALSLASAIQACGDDATQEQEALETLALELDEADGGGSTDDGGGSVAGFGGLTGAIGGADAGFPGGSLDGGFIGGDGGFIGGLGGLDSGFIDGGFIGGDGGFISGLDGGIIVPPDGGFGGLLGGDGGFPGGAEGPQPFAHWTFDDCGPSTTLHDSSPNQADAVRSTQVACSEGMLSGAVLFDQKKDTITVAAQPAFALAERLALALWIHPTNVQAAGNIVSKEANGNKIFQLSVRNGNLIFHINIDNGRRIRTVTSKAPIQANRWTHVAAMFDGAFVRLFEDGQQVGQIAVSGTIADDEAASISIGNNQAQEFVRGRLDDVWLSSDVVTPAEIAARSCIIAPATVAATPASSGPQDPGASFTYDIAITNNDRGGCPARGAFVSLFRPPTGFSITTVPDFLEVIPQGSTGHVTLSVTSSFDAEPGNVRIPVDVFTFGDGDRIEQEQNLSTEVEYVLKTPTGCFVRTSRELLMRDLSIVEDPLRTTFSGSAEDPRTGAWTFARLMEQLAPSDADAPAMVEDTLRTWLTNQTINTFAVPARSAMETAVLTNWPRTPDGRLDLKRSPMRLLAIVNRIDSRNLAQGHAGEGRFVFGVLGNVGPIGRDFPLQFTFIFEYRLPAKTTADVQAWADRWHALGALPFPSEQYNAALQDITDDFTLRGAEPGRVNGSALAQLRTNEIALVPRWELREFELSSATNRLAPSTVKLTPDTSFLSGSPLVAAYVNANEASILLEQHVVPETFQGQPFLGGSSFNDLLAWTAPGITNNEARHKFSLNTCNGCHASDENGTAFLHIFPRSPGQVSSVSGFMAGTVVPDPVTRAPRSFNDLGRRNQDLTRLVCPEAAPPAVVQRSATSSVSTTTTREAFLSKGISRTH